MSGSSNIFDSGGSINITGGGGSGGGGLSATQLSQITGSITSVSNQLTTLVSTINTKSALSLLTDNKTILETSNILNDHFNQLSGAIEIVLQ